jgi:hypothetical protein
VRSGCHVKRFVWVILHGHRDFDGDCFLDAPWRMLHPCVTSIVMALICKAAISRAVCFGGTENSEFYERCFMVLVYSLGWTSLVSQ